MKRNKFLRWLRKESQKLPFEFYEANHRLHQPMFIETEEGEKADITKTDGENKEIGLKLVNTVQQKHFVNHYRRLKRGFSKEGFAFINNYFKKRGFITQEELNLIQNGQSNQVTTAEV